MKNFVVKYRIGESSVIERGTKAVHVLMDGHKMRRYASLPDRKGGSLTGVQTSDNKMRPFVFADIRMTGVDHPPSPTTLSYSTYILHSRAIQMKTRCSATPA